MIPEDQQNSIINDVVRGNILYLFPNIWVYIFYFSRFNTTLIILRQISSLLQTL